MKKNKWWILLVLIMAVAGIFIIRRQGQAELAIVPVEEKMSDDQIKNFASDLFVVNYKGKELHASSLTELEDVCEVIDTLTENGFAIRSFGVGYNGKEPIETWDPEETEDSIKEYFSTIKNEKKVTGYFYAACLDFGDKGNVVIEYSNNKNRNITISIKRNSARINYSSNSFDRLGKDEKQDGDMGVTYTINKVKLQNADEEILKPILEGMERRSDYVYQLTNDRYSIEVDVNEAANNKNDIVQMTFINQLR